MEIFITNDNTAEYIEAANKILWRLTLKKPLLLYLLILVLGLFFLITGITQGYDVKASTSEYYKHTSKVVNKIILYNYHISFGFGVALILLANYFIYLIYRQKKSFFRAVRRMSINHRSANNKFTIQITDESICYQDFELSREEKWTIFSEYKIVGKHIFLFRNSYLLSAFPIPTKHLTINELTNLLQFLKNKLI